MTNEKEKSKVVETTKNEGKETSSNGIKPTEKQYSSEDIQAVLKTPEAQDLMKSMLAEMLKNQPQPTMTVNYQKEEMVTLLYMGAVADGSMVTLWQGFEIQGRGGTRDVPKREFLQNLSPKVLKRLKDRRLIVVDGFDDSERERYDLKYTDGELASVNIYYKLLSYDEEKILSIFKSVCTSHKAIIASLFKTAYMQGDNRINQPLIEKLNKISQSVEPKGMFKDILKDMAKALSDDGETESEEE